MGLGFIMALMGSRLDPVCLSAIMVALITTMTAASSATAQQLATQHITTAMMDLLQDRQCRLA